MESDDLLCHRQLFYSSSASFIIFRLPFHKLTQQIIGFSRYGITPCCRNARQLQVHFTAYVRLYSTNINFQSTCNLVKYESWYQYLKGQSHTWMLRIFSGFCHSPVDFRARSIRAHSRSLPLTPAHSRSLLHVLMHEYQRENDKSLFCLLL